MTAFQVYHMRREHGEGSSKFGGVDGASVNVWGSMWQRTPWKEEKEEYGGRDSLEKGKYLANFYAAARVNGNYKLYSFFPMLFYK